MVTDLLALADQLWRGELDTREHHPFAHHDALAEPADRTGFVASFANVTALRTDEGLVLVDTGSSLLSGAAHDTIRRWSDDPASTVVFTHGHIDHCFGVDRYDADNAAPGRRAVHGRRARGGPRALRPLPRHAWLQHGHQPAAVLVPGRPVRLAVRVPLPRSDVPAAPRPGRRRRAARAAPRPGGDRRPHVGVGAVAARAVQRRPLHLGVAELRATRRRCSATRATGPWRSGRWRRSTPTVLLPGARPADRRRRPGPRGAPRDAPRSSSISTTRRSR